MGKYRVVAIERQYASSGLAVGEAVAKELGIPCYGREILEMTAKKLHVKPENIEHMEETAQKSLLYDLALMTQAGLTGNGFQADKKVFWEESKIIQQLAMEQSCIIVGRCASGVLKERKDCLRVFVYADFESRVKRAVEQYGVPKETVVSVLKQTDKRRASFYKSNMEKRWDDWKGYHICLNSGVLGIEQCADIIVGMMKKI